MINWSLREVKAWIPRPVLNVARSLRRWIDSQHRFDRRFGVDTTGMINPSDLDIDPERGREAAEYQATPPAMFKRIFESLDVDHREFVFVDLGSGKGAALLYASQFPFRRITGVELSKRLHDIAEENIRKFRSSSMTRCLDIESRCGDATQFDLPQEPTVLYLANPFKGQVLNRVIANVQESLLQNPREILIVYYHPLSRHDEWDRCSFVRYVRKEPQFSVYRATSEAELS